MKQIQSVAGNNACGFATVNGPRYTKLTAARPHVANPQALFHTVAMGCMIWCMSVGTTVHAQVPGVSQINVIGDLPTQSPDWLPGYEVRWPVRVMGDVPKSTAKTVMVSIPSGGWLRPDAADLAVQAPTGDLLPHQVLSHDSQGDTIVQFERSANVPWYWVYGRNPKVKAKAPADPKAMAEGISLEVREFKGADLSSWAKIQPDLEKSKTVIGNAIVTDIVQNCCPARPDITSQFACSYRGTLNIAKEGTYYFLLTADEAAFLFVDGFKIYEQPGGGKARGSIKVSELKTISGKLDLTPGPHKVEVHHVIGDSAQPYARCSLVWMTPDNPKVHFIPAASFAQPLYARAAALERKDGPSAGAFNYGLEDTIETPGIQIYLMRFEADGPVKDEKSLVWDFGDGTTGTGRSVTHVYFKEGDVTVKLKAGETPLPEYTRRIHIWPEPGETGPLTLENAVESIGQMEWRKLKISEVREILSFLELCGQPNRWPLQDQVAEFLLEQKDLDLDAKSQYMVARLDALANQNKAGEAVKLGESWLPLFAKTPALQVRIMLSLAAVQQYHFKDATAASKLYKEILDKHSRTEHPNLRTAAIRWGDLFAEAGDVTKATETYRIAATLGGEKFASTATTDATTRGALLRIAEQKLKGGEILATRQLLERVEMDYPGRRIDGLYCFLKAESDRFAGRYEDAQRNYEMIFKLPQWAGYKDRATFGIADSYLRMGDFDKGLKWLGDLQETFPQYFKEQNLGQVMELTKERFDRVKEAKAQKKPPFTSGFLSGFEPEEKDWFGDTKEFSIARAPGMNGPHVALLDVLPKPIVSYDYYRPVPNLTPGGMYYAEIWLKDYVRTPFPPTFSTASLQGMLLPADRTKPGLAGQPANIPRNSHHQWHKFGMKIPAPRVNDGWLRLVFSNITGYQVIDRVSLRPVQDRHLDSLLIFQQGAKAP